jgi:hypothetical protein
MLPGLWLWRKEDLVERRLHVSMKFILPLLSSNSTNLALGVTWQAGTLVEEECPPRWSFTPRPFHFWTMTWRPDPGWFTDDVSSAPEVDIEGFTLVGTMPRTAPIESRTITKPASMGIAPPTPVTVAFDSPTITAAPIVNRPTANVPRPSGGDNFPSDIRNALQPSVPVQSNPEALNTSEEVPVYELETTTMISVGESTTVTIVTEVPVPRRTNSIGTSSRTQESTETTVT